ncbi:MAG: FtsX-like permease family protein, partial [Paracoccaceae bacterium]
MLAVGLPPSLMRRLMIGEAAIVAAVGCALGAGLGVGYTAAMLLGLRTIWADAINSAAIRLFVSPVTVIAGTASAFALAIAAVYLATRRR